MSKSLDQSNWRPDSWQSRPAQQQPVYTDKAALETAVASLSRLPPIVVSWEVEALKEQIAAAQRVEDGALDRFPRRADAVGHQLQNDRAGW